jgi:hypothetical protein
MLIELEEPFKSLWVKGYLNTDSDNRRRIVFYNNPNDRSGMTYARYLMCVKLGYILPTELEVDHKDNDKTNDDVSNLQVLTKLENVLKQQQLITDSLVMIDHQCSNCPTVFTLSESVTRKRFSGSKTKLLYCSKSCARTSK